MTQTFIRTEMLPPEAPPARDAGAVKWLRENLFSGPLNTILTLLGLFILYWGLSGLLPWIFGGVWNAGSLGECRDIIAARTGGDGTEAACWAMIRERWHQYLFGFYPSNLYWRPTLAFGLLFVALAPVLFSQFPRKMFLFTLAYPAVAYLLLWGGSVWVPVMLILLVGAVFFLSTRIGGGWGVATFVVLILLCFGNPLGNILWFLFRLVDALPFVSIPVAFEQSVLGFLAKIFPLFSHVHPWVHSVLPWGLTPVNSDQFGGFLLAIVIGVTAISFSLPLGIILALGRQSDMFIVKSLSVGFIEFIRGVPLITLLFTASLLLQYFLPPGTNFDLILRVIILVTFFAAAYLAEVIRGGLAALPRGQYEAADALGLNYWQAQRLIIMPQALKISIPGIVSTFIGLFKDTTLVSFVGLLDPLRGVTMAVRADINWKGIYWEPYVFVGAIFFVICFSMSRYSMYLERKLKTDHR
jgi:general L-amino acid transport system permease protein